LHTKEQKLIENSDTRYIGFLSRLINFLEDILEDAECETIYVSRNIIDHGVVEPVYIKPINCFYDPGESTKIFADKWELEGLVTISHGDLDFKELYYHIPRVYSLRIHYMLKDYALKTMASHREYYFAILFNGKAFLVEGEKNQVFIPYVRHCLSAHTHPARIAIPSGQDLKTITKTMLNRGFLHAIESIGQSLVFYRIAPFTEDDLITIMKLGSLDNYREIINTFRKLKSLRAMVI